MRSLLIYSKHSREEAGHWQVPGDLESLGETEDGRVLSPWFPPVGLEALSPLFCLPRSS